MPLSWNEIKSRALTFSREWKGEGSERAEAQSFWNGFFAVFGVDRKRVAVFERQVAVTRAGKHLKSGRIVRLRENLPKYRHDFMWKMYQTNPISFFRDTRRRQERLFHLGS